ncbi:MAG: AlpA family phage regulatory protein [Desulfuromonadales bacterium]|nr:AlpA family phage regulatory protein [Desulfuromonadales bacterium]
MNKKLQPLPPYIPPHKIKDVLGFFGRTKALELESSDPTFPKRIRLPGSHLTAWRTSDLIEWLNRYGQPLS